MASLRERSDIRTIVERLIEEDLDGRAPGSVRVGDEVMRFFERYAWPGNIRQLQNVLRVALALLEHDEDVIQPRHLPEEIFSAEATTAEGLPAPARLTPPVGCTPPKTRGQRLKDVQEDTILRVLAEYDGNVSAAARALGIARNTLYRKLGRDF